MHHLFSNKHSKKNTPDTRKSSLVLFKGNLKRLVIGAIAVMMLVSALGNIITAVPAQAAAAGACADSGNYQPYGGGVCKPGDEATSYSYYVALGGCVQNNMGQGSPNFPVKVSENGNATTAEMFDNNQAFGYVFPGGTKTDCKDIMTKALQLWGWTGSTQTFLEAMGNVYKIDTANGTAQYIGVSDGAKRLKNFQNIVQNKVYGGKAPTLSAAATYDIDYNGFTMNGGACSSKDLGLYTDLDSTRKRLVDAGSPADASSIADLPAGTIGSALYTHVTEIGGSPVSSSDHVYVYLASTSTPSRYSANTAQTTQVLYGYHTTTTSRSCTNLAKALNGGKPDNSKYPGALKQWMLDNSGILDTLATTQCSDGSTVSVGQSCPSTTPVTSCVIDGVGWIVCSVANFFASVSDGIYGLIANLLRVPIINTDTGSGTNGVYNAWMIMRNLANVAFVISFLIIIFSQITSLGVSNYGVKKTLPRLVVAAVLVNISFWVSAVAVDVSNILGAGIYDLMSGVKGNMNVSISANWGNIIGGLLAGGTLSAIVATGTIAFGTAIIASGGGMAIVFLALPLVLAAVLAVLVAALVLIARQALVVILIIISPLAFVALLLPNTEKLFSKWRSALLSTLLMYPIISIVFGGAQIAGLAIMSTAAKTPDFVTTALAIVVGQTVMVIPFFFIPTLIMKFSGDNLTGLASTMMSKGKGLIGGISGAARKEGRGRFGRSINTMKYGESAPKGILGRGVRRFGRSFDQIKDQQGNADKYLGHERSTTTRERLASDTTYATRSAAGSTAGGKVLTLRAQAAGEAEELEEAKSAIIQTNMSSGERHTLAMTGSVTLSSGTTLSGDAMQRAALQEQFRAGSYGQQKQILEAAGENKEFGKKFGQTISGGVASNGLGGKDPALAGRRLEDLSQGNFVYGDAVKQAITEGKYTAEAFAGMNDDARAQAIQIARTAEAEGDPSLITALQSAAIGIQNSVDIRGKISGNTTAATQIASLIPPPTSTP
jgi:hypothetical protein